MLLCSLGLPSTYSIRAAMYAATSAGRVTFVALLIGEWKIIVLGATFLLSVFAIVGLPHAVDHVVLKTLGFASLACGMMTFAFSSLLIVAFSAHHAHLDGRSNDVSVDVERQQIANAPLAAMFDPGQNKGIFWNHYVLIAQPAIWMAWFSIFSVSFLLLFIWKVNYFAVSLSTDISKSPIEAIVPGMAFTVIFTVGLIHLVLTVRMLRSL